MPTNPRRAIFLVICGLLVAVLTALSVLILVNIMLKSEQNSKNRLIRSTDDLPTRICTSAACVRQSIVMISAMNLSVDPCMNFYQYACGRWDQANYVDLTKKDEISNLNRVLEDDQHLVIKKILEQPTESLLSNAEKLAQRYYQSCVQTIIPTARPGKMLLELLDQIGGWPGLQKFSERFPFKQKWDVQPVFQTVHNILNVDAFFHWSIQLAPTTNLSNPEKHMIKLFHSGLSISNISNYLVDDDEETITWRLQDLITKVTTSFWLNIDDSPLKESYPFKVAMTDVSEVELRIARITYPIVNMKAESYEYTTIADLNTLAPFIDWNKYFQSAFSQVNITITQSHTVLVSSTTFFRDVSILVRELLESEEGQRKLINYLSWRITYRHFQILEKSWKKTEGDMNSWKDCIFDTIKAMPFAVSAMFVRKRFDSESSKHFAETSTKSIKEVFKENLNKNDWLDDETRVGLRNKVDAMSSLIGYPEIILNSTKLDMFYSGLEVESSEYFVNNVKLERYLFRKQLMKLDQSFDIIEWAILPFEMFRPYSRSIELNDLLSGVLHQPIFDDKLPHVLHFGSIGSFFRYELQNTNFENSKQLFERNRKSQQLSNNTNIQRPVDSGGLKATYEAYINWTNTNNEKVVLPLSGLTHYQLFFLSFAQSWCWDKREDVKSIAFLPKNFQIDRTFSYMPEFSSAFHCSEKPHP